MMQTDVKAVSLAASGDIYAGRARIRGMVVEPGASAGSIIVKDGGSGWKLKSLCQHYCEERRFGRHYAVHHQHNRWRRDLQRHHPGRGRAVRNKRICHSVQRQSDGVLCLSPQHGSEQKGKIQRVA